MDIYEEVTRRIVEQLEQGEIPWRKPWIAGGSCVSYATGKPYSLLNQMLLGKPGEYLTFRQCQQAGGHIRRGEKAHMVVFWKWIEQENEETGEKKQIPFLRYYSVFYINQCEGIAARHAKPLPQTADTDEAAERIISAYLQNSGVKLEHVEGDQACYRPSDDSVTLPLRAQFAETAEYYSTAFHELTHSTGHSKRLNRLEQTAFFWFGSVFQRRADRGNRSLGADECSRSGNAEQLPQQRRLHSELAPRPEKRQALHCQRLGQGGESRSDDPEPIE